VTKKDNIKIKMRDLNFIELLFTVKVLSQFKFDACMLPSGLIEELKRDYIDFNSLDR
jgi:hypothetical protein